jgi:membrane-associated phospholipid phosphatase
VTTLDLVVNLTLAVVLIIGAYQFYFWCQRKTNARARSFRFRLDDTIQLRPAWVWIYSGFYYPAIFVVVWSASDRFLSFVQKFDARSNCFPSVHVSVATLTASHTIRNLACDPALPTLFVVLICISCILTKQHYLIDIPGGLLLGWLSFHFFLRLL